MVEIFQVDYFQKSVVLKKLKTLVKVIFILTVPSKTWDKHANFGYISILLRYRNNILIYKSTFYLQNLFLWFYFSLLFFIFLQPKLCHFRIISIYEIVQICRRRHQRGVFTIKVKISTVSCDGSRYQNYILISMQNWVHKN